MPDLTLQQEYNKGRAPDDNDMRVEIAVNDIAEAIVFHNRPFSHPLSWLEFDLDHGKLTFVMGQGDFKDFFISVHPDLTKYMQNAFQVLMVLMDESNEPVEGGYIPLILHRT